METILQKPNYGDYKSWRPNTETPYYLQYMYIDPIGDPIQRYIYIYIYKSFSKMKLIAKKTNLIAKTTNLIEKPYKF